MNIKTITAAAVAALSTIAGPAQAYGQAEFTAHQALYSAVENAGVTIYVNPTEVCDEDDAPMGLYAGAHSVMVICQDNRVKGSDKEVTWTANDLDTLRHEAHHLAQDCINGARDGDIAAVYKRPVELGYSVMGEAKTNWVAETYAANGASGHVQVMEIEAFAVAQANNPAEQVADLGRYCF